MKAITVTGLGLGYGATPVLRDLSFAVAAGEFFVIIGPNGSGKTSLLRAIGGLLHPGSGSIAILGRDQKSYSRRALARTVAVVPQQMPLDFPFTVRDTVLMGRSPHLGLMSIERQEDFRLAEEAMAFTEVAHLADRHLDQLSGGERQRVIIARAICQQPRVILLDEPTAALDPAHQVRVMDLMERLRRERGVTVFMVSHDLNLAAMYGDRLLLLKEGRAIEIGPPAAVLRYDLLEEAYGCLMLVDPSPLDGVPRVLPVPEKYSRLHDSQAPAGAGRKQRP